MVFILTPLSCINTIVDLESLSFNKPTYSTTTDPLVDLICEKLISIAEIGSLNLHLPKRRTDHKRRLKNMMKV